MLIPFISGAVNAVLRGTYRAVTAPIRVVKRAVDGIADFGKYIVDEAYGVVYEIVSPIMR